MNSENLIHNNENGSRFIDSIREKAEKQSREIQEETHREIERLKDQAEREVQEFLRESQDETNRHIAAELEKVQNRYEIDKRKMRLSLIEEITRELTQRALVAVRSGGKKHYEEMLRKNIEGIYTGDPQKGKFFCSSEDVSLMETLQQELKKTMGLKKLMAVEADPSVSGGFIFVDQEKGQSINYTFERIMYRRMDQIRREVFNAIADRITLNNGK